MQPNLNLKKVIERYVLIQDIHEIVDGYDEMESREILALNKMELFGKLLAIERMIKGIGEDL